MFDHRRFEVFSQESVPRVPEQKKDGKFTWEHRTWVMFPWLPFTVCSVARRRNPTKLIENTKAPAHEREKAPNVEVAHLVLGGTPELKGLWFAIFGPSLIVQSHEARIALFV